MVCNSNKRCYPTEQIAEEALIQTRIRFENNSALAIYQCNNCGEWHLTSSGEVNTTLQSLLDNGTIKKERDAMHWDMKWK